MNVAGKSQGQKWLRLNAHIKRERQFLCKMQMTLDLNLREMKKEIGTDLYIRHLKKKLSPS